MALFIRYQTTIINLEHAKEITYRKENLFPDEGDDRMLVLRIRMITPKNDTPDKEDRGAIVFVEEEATELWQLINQVCQPLHLIDDPL